MALRPGTVIGGEYVIGRPLAQGGMGAVYAAVQQSTGAERALKVMHPSLVGDDRLRTMFDREARASARIDSDHVVQVLAAGVDDETGSPWLVMEMLEGETLTKALADRPLSFEDAARVMAELFHALGAAHGGLDPMVHRDLKPDNVFLAKTKRRDGSWTVKLLDFGIAKVLDDARGAGTTQAAGTPLWMAPEQADNGKVSPATDVWALGLVAFATLTGKVYWLAASGNATGSAAGLLREILLSPIAPASERALELGVSVPAGFDSWFAKCVAREPGERFVDANAARDAWDALVVRNDGSTDATAFAPLSSASISGAAKAETGAKPAATPQVSARSPRRWWRVALLAGLAGGIAAIIAIPRGPATAPVAEKLGALTTARSSAAIEPTVLAWAHSVVDPPLPPETDKVALEARRGPLEAVVNSALVRGDIKPKALGLLAKLPAQRLPTSSIRSTVLEQAFPIARGCYQAELKDHPKLAITVAVGFMINGDGSVKNAYITKTTYQGPSMLGCMLRAFQGLKFPPTSDGESVSVTYPMQFDSSPD